MSGALVCDGELSVSTGSPVCDGFWMLVQVPAPFDPSSLDAGSIAQAFGVGFISVGTVLFAIAGVRALIHLVKSE